MKESSLKRLKEEFTGRRNVVTVTMVLIGGYFIAYPLVNIVTAKLGYNKTMILGAIILVVGDFLIDAFHKED